MMPEISLNILDVAQNSISAKASLIEIDIIADHAGDLLTVRIADNGCGMTKEQVSRVIDPFYTTRTTRSVGLGVPFFKFAAESTGGSFTIKSEAGKGTEIIAVFGLSNIDRMPLGNITDTIHMLITFNLEIDFIYRYVFDDREFTLDTREFREVLGDVPFNSPEVSAYIKEYLTENKTEADGNTAL